MKMETILSGKQTNKIREFKNVKMQNEIPN